MSSHDDRAGRPAPAVGGDDREIEELLLRAQAGDGIEVPAISGMMQEARRYPPLSGEDQTRLVATYQASLKLEQALQAQKVNARQRRDAQKTIRRGQDCITYLVVSNFRLVQLIAREQLTKRYPSRDRLAELLPDLINEGNLALTEAAQKYDVSRGPHFTAYAARAIRDRVRYVLSRSVPVRMSASWSRIQRIARRTIPELQDRLGRSPSTEELQEALLAKCLVWAEGKLTPEQMNLSESKRNDLMMAKLRKQGMLGAIDAIDEVLQLGQSAASLDATVGSDGDTTLGDMVSAEQEDVLFDNVELQELGQALQAALSTLSDRERMIVLYRYGFVDGESWTYDRIAAQYDVTSERIRQIEKAVMGKLRGPGSSYGGLSSFLPGQFE